jgi:hypothetical protein
VSDGEGSRGQQGPSFDGELQLLATEVGEQAAATTEPWKGRE